MGRYLNETGRPIVYSCSWPAYQEPLGIEVTKLNLFFRKLLKFSYYFSLIIALWPKLAIYGVTGTILMMLGQM